MSFVGNMVGLGGNSGNAGYNFAAQSAPLLATTNAAQLNTAYDTSQNALKQQQDMVNALSAQHGIQNQSQVYNQLQNVAQGKTANLAGAQLAQSTGQNVASQAALAAGQRGASQNVGMIARGAANQGANIQQQAAGQGAILQAQQQQQALGQLSGLSTQQVGQQQGAVSTLNQAAQSEQQNLLNAAASMNSANVENTSNMNNIGLAQAQSVEKNQQQMATFGAQAAGQLLQSIGGGGVGMAQGGEVGDSKPMYADGGSTDSSGPASSFGKFIGGQSSQPQMTATPPPPAAAPSDDSGGGGGPNPAMLAMMLAHGGKVPAMVSPGERYLPPNEVKKVAEGKKAPIKAGQKIPGQAKVKGNSYANDTVPKDLESGGIVLPRSVTQAKDAPEKAKAFVAAILAKKGKLPSKPSKSK